jgi:hypothetical protein
MNESADTVDSDDDGFQRWFTARNVRNVLIGYVAVYVVVGILLRLTFGKIENPGIFGDMFGVLNAFVSGLAMLGVIAAILLQMDQNRMQAKELKLQRNELELTRDELKGQKEALEGQTAQARRTSEAAIMSQLMVEYDTMRDLVRTLQKFYDEHKPLEEALETFRRGRLVADHKNDIAAFVDPARFRLSRFFVRMRKLSNGGYLSRRIIWLALGRAAIEDVFLALVDPLDQVVNDIAGRRASIADRDFYKQLLTDRETLEH